MSLPSWERHSRRPGRHATPGPRCDSSSRSRLTRPRLRRTVPDHWPRGCCSAHRSRALGTGVAFTEDRVAGAGESREPVVLAPRGPGRQSPRRHLPRGPRRPADGPRPDPGAMRDRRLNEPGRGCMSPLTHQATQTRGPMAHVSRSAGRPYPCPPVPPGPRRRELRLTHMGPTRVRRRLQALRWAPSTSPRASAPQLAVVRAAREAHT
jgi:hypothetical protein